MKRLGLWVRRKKRLAGLFVMGDKIQYLALDIKRGGLSVKAMAEVDLEMAPSQRDVWADPGMLENRMLKIKREVGARWFRSAVLGIQAKDVMVKVIQLPRVEDGRGLRELFKMDFDKHFPFPASEAVFDVATIEHPLDAGGDVSYAVAAVSRSRPVESIIEVCGKVGLMVDAVEPSVMAAFRAMQGPEPPSERCNLYVMAGFYSSFIVVSYKDSGILYRNVSYGFGNERPDEEVFVSFAREIYSSANFVTTQLKGLGVGKIYIGGYGLNYADEIKEAVSSMTLIPVETVDPWDLWEIEGAPEERWGWDVTLGLALRGVDDE